MTDEYKRKKATNPLVKQRHDLEGMHGNLKGSTFAKVPVSILVNPGKTQVGGGTGGRPDTPLPTSSFKPFSKPKPVSKPEPVSKFEPTMSGKEFRNAKTQIKRQKVLAKKNAAPLTAAQLATKKAAAAKTSAAIVGGVSTALGLVEKAKRVFNK